MRNLDNIKVKTKSLLMILIIGVFVFILSLIGATFLRNSNQQYHTSINNNKIIVEQGIKSISTLIDFRTVVLRLDSSNSSLARKDFETAKSELKVVYDEAKKSLNEYKSLIEQNIQQNSDNLLN